VGSAVSTSLRTPPLPSLRSHSMLAMTATKPSMASSAVAPASTYTPSCCTVTVVAPFRVSTGGSVSSGGA
jgi:hypothetical protein